MERLGVVWQGLARQAWMEESRMAEPIDASDPNAVAELIREDREQWPDGHPCRDCGCLYKDHPNPECAAWH